jgi:nitrogen fixation protein FixH
MQKSAYRWFPWGLFAGMMVAFLVNAYMVYAAVESFPGVAGQDGFDLSKRYDQVIAVAAKQAELGWQVEATLDDAQRPVLHVTDRAGAPLSGTAIKAEAQRPLGPAERTLLAFHPLDAEHYQADTALESGQWDVLVTVTTGDSRYTTTRRLLVK